MTSAPPMECREESTQSLQAFAMCRAWIRQDCGRRVWCLIKLLERPDEKKKACHCNYSMASAFELIFTCVRASLESGFDCVVGGLRLVASWLDLPRFPMQTHVRSDGQHIALHHLIGHWYLTNSTRGLLGTTECFDLLVRSTQ